MKIFPIAIDVLPKQGDFLIALIHEGFAFFQDVFFRAAPFPAPRVRNDAIRAEFVAAIRDVDVGLARIEAG